MVKVNGVPSHLLLLCEPYQHWNGTRQEADDFSCAIGAAYEGRYHHSLITFPKSVADFFADKSKLLLEFELDSPCVSTFQTLLLLSCHEAACGRDVRMWLYSGKLQASSD